MNIKCPLNLTERKPPKRLHNDPACVARRPMTKSVVKDASLRCNVRRKYSDNAKWSRKSKSLEA